MVLLLLQKEFLKGLSFHISFDAITNHASVIRMGERCT